MLWTALASELRGWRSWYFLRRPVLWTLALFCVTLAVLNASEFFRNDPSRQIASALGARVCATAVVDAQPDPRPTGTVLSVRLETLTLLTSTPTVTQSLDEHILLQVLGKSSIDAQPGDRVRACGSLHEPKSSEIPGMFDYATFLANHDIQAVLYAGARSFHNWGEGGRFQLQRWGWTLKQRVIERFEKNLSPEQAAVMAGLVVGQRPRFYPELKDIFLRSGTMHVLVASGSNVAFVMLMWFLLMRCVRIPNRWALATSLAPVWMYTLISGGDAPIVRAAIMGTTLTISHLMRRWDKAFNALGIAAWIILIANPRALFDVGFQMSFTTVLGLMLTMPVLERACAGVPTVLKWPMRVLGASVTAQLWLIPVSIHSFHHIYIWSVFSNMIVVPMAGLGLPLGVGIVVWSGLGLIVGWYAQILLWTVSTMATYLGARTWMAPLPFCVIAGYYLLCLSFPRIRETMLARSCALLGVILMIAGQLISLHRETTTPLRVSWIDAGRSVATLIESANDRLLVLPERAANDQSLERIVLPFLTTERRRPVFALMMEDTATVRTKLTQELIRTCSISTVTVCGEPIVWLKSAGHTLLLASALSLRVQRQLLEELTTAPDMIAARFPPRWKWDPRFVERFKPQLIVETGNPRRNSPNNSPWPDVPMVVPQQQGWFEWTASDLPPTRPLAPSGS